MKEKVSRRSVIAFMLTPWQYTMEALYRACAYKRARELDIDVTFDWSDYMEEAPYSTYMDWHEEAWGPGILTVIDGIKESNLKDE